MAGGGTERLRRELGLFDVFAVAVGTTLSAGFFLLPGLAVAKAGAAVPVAYALAMIPLVPAVFSIVELATAMPRAGGSYYFLDRSLGPVMGAIGGFGTWLALVLKTAFALVGMGAYLALVVPELPIVPAAVGAAVLLGIVNAWGTREAGRVQRVLVMILLGILAWFIGTSTLFVKASHFAGATDVPVADLLSTTALVYVSYVGMTKVASLAEEVRNPERNLPLGVLLALACVAVVYVLGTTVMVGVVPVAALRGDLAPAGVVGAAIAGQAGVWIMVVAAVLASVSVATAGLMSASRYPLAMARDALLPEWLSRVSSRGIPVRGLVVTTAAVCAVLLLVDVASIAKLAGAFQLLLFAFLNLAVIVMRESQIASYDPGFRSPLYPWMQGFGVLAPFVLIESLGFGPALFCVVLIGVGGGWYFGYARARVDRAGAIYHVFERLGRMRFDALDVELRSIMKEKGLRAGDRFEDVLAAASVIDLPPDASYEQAVARAARELARRIDHEASELARRFLEGTRTGSTPVDRGVAIPHLRVDPLDAPQLVIARSAHGLRLGPVPLPFGLEAEPVFAIFFLVSPLANAGQHLRFLAQLAVRAEGGSFLADLRAAPGADAVRELLLRDESMLDLTIQPDGPGAEWIGHALKDVRLPEGCLVVVIRRSGAIVIPRGNTVIEAGDRLSILGNIEAVRALRMQLGA